MLFWDGGDGMRRWWRGGVAEGRVRSLRPKAMGHLRDEDTDRQRQEQTQVPFGNDNKKSKNHTRFQEPHQISRTTSDVKNQPDVKNRTGCQEPHQM